LEGKQITIGTAFRNCYWWQQCKHCVVSPWKPADSPDFFKENDKQLYECGLEYTTSDLPAQMPSKQILGNESKFIQVPKICPKTFF